MSSRNESSLAPQTEYVVLSGADKSDAVALITAVLATHARTPDEPVLDTGFPESVSLRVQSPRGVSLTIEARPIAMTAADPGHPYNRPSENLQNLTQYLLGNPGRGFRTTELQKVVKGNSSNTRLILIRRSLITLAGFPPDGYRLYYGEDGHSQLGKYYSMVPSSDASEEPISPQSVYASWEKEAACGDKYPGIFDQMEAGEKGLPSTESKVQAQAVCSMCAVSTPCLADSLDNEDVKFHMIRSGLGDKERAAIVERSRAEGAEAAARYAIELQQASFERGQAWFARSRGRLALYSV